MFGKKGKCTEDERKEDDPKRGRKADRGPEVGFWEKEAAHRS